MSYLRIETQGESHLAIFNSDHVTHLTEGIYGTAIHFVSGDSLICVGDLTELARQIFGSDPQDLVKKTEETFLIRESAQTV